MIPFFFIILEYSTVAVLSDGNLTYTMVQKWMCHGIYSDKNTKSMLPTWQMSKQIPSNSELIQISDCSTSVFW